MIFLFVLFLFVAYPILWIRQKKRYWAERGALNHVESLSYFGRTEHLATYTQSIYQNYKNSGQRFVGFHLYFQPAALLVNLDFIKHILIQEFETFPGRGLYHNTRDDPLSGNLVRLEGEPWKRLRAKYTTTFTSAKMRYMSDTLVGVAKRFADLVSELVQPEEAVLEVCDLCARFTTDVIGMVAFGIECDSLREPNTTFRLMGDRAFQAFNFWAEAFGTKFPRLARGLHMTAFPRELIEFYTRIITENIAYREQHKIRRNDFLDIFIELKNTQVNGEFVLSVKEIVAQSFVFFIGGFETSSSTIAFCLYELGLNPDIQQRVREEVMQCLLCHDNQLTYECLKDMKYLQQMVSETLRKYPVVPLLKRVSRKNYVVPQSQQVIENGVQAIISTYAIHHDPEYYPNPEVFDPDRFSPEAIKARHPMAYLPFGAGPRVCIAQRFGRMQTMIGVAMLLSQFRFSKTAETQKSIEFNVKEKRFYSVKGGIRLKVSKI